MPEFLEGIFFQVQEILKFKPLLEPGKTHSHQNY